jgi:hypothetical protein
MKVMAFGLASLGVGEVGVALGGVCVVVFLPLFLKALLFK